MKEFILTIILCLFVFSLGFCSSQLYLSYKEDKINDDGLVKIAGLWLTNYNYSEVQKKLYDTDNSGQWVCVNVNNGLSYEDIIRTCTHEASHELFARKCVSNPELCFNIEKEIKNEK